MMLLAFVACLLIAVGLFVWVKDHEERKAARRTQRAKELEACLALSHDWPPPNSPKGFEKRKKVA